MKKDKRWECVMSGQHKSALTRLSLNESVRLNQHISEAEIVRRMIEERARRRQLWDG